MNPSLATIGLVALCGGVGSVVRLLVATGVRNAAGEPYLLGTLVVNLIGCFLFGVAWGYASGNWSKAMQAAVFTGFFGGFTTFSSFAFESYELFVQGRIGERITGDAVTLRDDGLMGHGLGVPLPIDVEGQPRRPTLLIDAGVARGSVWDHRSGRRNGFISFISFVSVLGIADVYD